MAAPCVLGRSHQRLSVGASIVKGHGRLSLVEIHVRLATPGTLPSAIFTVIGQAAQFIPGTDKVTVLVPAETGPLKATASAKQGHTSIRFMTISNQ